MTTAALEFIEEQLSARPIGKVHWDEVIFMLMVFNTHGEDDEAVVLVGRHPPAALVVGDVQRLEAERQKREDWLVGTSGAAAG